MDISADRPRREEYADQTRAAVIAAARQLFAENGFFQTKVEQIAKLSRVSPGDGVRAVRRQARLAAIAHGQLDAVSGSRRVSTRSHSPPPTPPW